MRQGLELRTRYKRTFLQRASDVLRYAEFPIMRWLLIAFEVDSRYELAASTSSF